MTDFLLGIVVGVLITYNFLITNETIHGTLLGYNEKVRTFFKNLKTGKNNTIG